MLLDDIIELATDSKQPITTLLRKCLVLAHQLKNEKLRAWSNKELDGYDSAEDIPDYRVLPAGATGLYVGPGWGRFQQGIPSISLEENHRKFAEVVQIAQAIGTLEHMVTSGSDSSQISFPWNDNLVLFYRNKIMRGWQLWSAQQTVPKSAVAGIVDTVRTRVLNMALEIRSTIGDKDEDLKKITPEESQKVDQTIVNNIYTGNVYVSGGSSTMTATTIQQQQQNIIAGDWEQLAKALRTAGVSAPEIGELSTAIERDGKTIGAKVKDWVKKTAPKVLSGGASVGQTLLLEYLKQYFGLG